ncbi:MAG TPA: hypothetical protein VFY71_10300 [Planctomycetota bacterium]|nr:hypothetical protein [Planctomycetota bacterium]
MLADRWAEQPEAFFATLSSAHRRFVYKAVQELCADPFGVSNIKQLSKGDLAGLWRRLVDRTPYRIIYDVDRENGWLLIYGLDRRPTVYTQADIDLSAFD